MVIKPKTIDDIAAEFTLKKNPMIKGYPDYKDIKTMKLLYTNADTLPTPQVGVQHEHIGIIINPDLYTILVDMA